MAKFSGSVWTQSSLPLILQLESRNPGCAWAHQPPEPAPDAQATDPPSSQERDLHSGLSKLYLDTAGRKGRDLLLFWPRIHTG